MCKRGTSNENIGIAKGRSRITGGGGAEEAGNAASGAIVVVGVGWLITFFVLATAQACEPQDSDDSKSTTDQASALLKMGCDRDSLQDSSGCLGPRVEFCGDSHAKLEKYEGEDTIRGAMVVTDETHRQKIFGCDEHGNALYLDGTVVDPTKIDLGLTEGAIQSETYEN